MKDPFGQRPSRPGAPRQFGEPYAPTTDSARWRPNVDVYESRDAVIVVVELAGVTPDQIEVVVEGRRLFISGTRTPASRRDTRRIHHLEIPHGRFHIAVELPVPVEPGGADASSRDGMLEITLPVIRPVHPAIKNAGAETERGRA